MNCALVEYNTFKPHFHRAYRAVTVEAWSPLVCFIAAVIWCILTTCNNDCYTTTPYPLRLNTLKDCDLVSLTSDVEERTKCIVIDFFLNNQPDALIIQIYSVIRLYMFRASSLCPSSGVLYCTFGTGKFHAGFWWPYPSIHPDSAWKRSSKTCM